MSVKFKDFEYKRPDIKRLEEQFNALISEFENSVNAEKQYDVLKKINALKKDFHTMRSIASIRYTINTEDKFYSDEHDYFNDIGPLFSGFNNEYYKAITNSKFRKELESIIGKGFFDIAEITIKTFKPEIIDDLKKENHLVTEYVKLIASAKIIFEDKERNLAGMSVFMQSENREVRKNSANAYWKFFEDNEKEFDRIYGDLVKVRTKIAGKLGYENYVQLGYDFMRRTEYTHAEVGEFRKLVKEYIVPVTQSLIEMKKKRIGMDKLFYYDSSFNFKNGNPVPKGSPEWIVEKAKIMYEELSEDTGRFINLMIDGDLMDLYNRKGKSAGGYCSYIPKYDSSFIFANMNGTAHDVRVLTHEAGHAFQSYESRNIEFIEYFKATSEASEVHSMSMEFITWPWMNLFFEDDANKFLFSHLSGALSFIPYGVCVDEFQHFVYENLDVTPDDRKKKWREIEKNYLPHIDYEENKFLERGGFWFVQGHIFKRPFYYIDYCLAQICALQFWRKCNHGRDVAWNDYLNLCKAGGSKPFLELLKIAKVDSPFDKKVIESVVSYCKSWIDSVSKDFDS